MAKLLGQIHGFFSWWFRELGGLVPRGLRAALRGRRGEAIFSLSDDTLRLSRRRDGKERLLGEIDLTRHGGASVLRIAKQKFGRNVFSQCVKVLRLARDKSLRQSIDLPLATEENLREVLAFEMDRRTPFKATDVYYDQQVKSRNKKTGRISVDLAVAPRRIVDDAVARALQWGLTLDRVEAAGDEDRDPGRLNLMPMRPRKGGRTARALQLALATTLVGLTAAALLIPLFDSRRTAERLQQDLAAARTSAQSVETLRAELDAFVKNTDQIVGRRIDTPLTIQVIDELSRILPDTSWVFQLRLARDEVQLHGYSETAADLLELFESSDLLTDAGFKSPVTRDARVDKERFHLSATVRSATGL